MREKIRKKLVWDEHGISEILADILILVMTVALFAVIFLFVWNLPAPDESTYADFEGTITLDAGGGTIDITHKGGENLRGPYTEIYLRKNYGQVIRQLKTKDSSDPYGDNPGGYGLQDDSMWSNGEIWTYYFGGVTSSDDLEVQIVDSKTGTLIMASKLLGAGVNDEPIIMERWYGPSPAINASYMNLYVRVMDPDGFGDISAPDSVYADVNPLNHTIGMVNFTMISNTDYIGEFKSADIFVEKGQGIYTLTVYAKDSSGLIDKARMVVNVAFTAWNAPKILERWSIPEVGVNSTAITIYARVEDIDGYDNIDYVSADIGNLTELVYSPNVVNMTDPEEDGIFEYTTTVNVLKGDLYNITFTAVDKTTLTDNAYLNVNVKKFRPVISRTWTVPVTGKDEESITIYAEVYDPDGYSDLNLSTIQVDVANLNPLLGWETMSDFEEDGIFEYNLTIDIAFGGNKTVNFIAKDMEGNNDTAEMSINIATTNPPVILERWTDPVFPDNGSDVTIFARVMDPDSYEDINYTGAVKVNILNLDRNLSAPAGWVNMTDPNWDGNFYHITLVDQAAGTYMLQFSATDLSGLSANATLNITIVPYMPRFLNIWTSPTIGKNGTSIEIFANVMDPNGYSDIDFEGSVKIDIVQLNESFNQSQPYWVNMTDYNQNGTFNYSMLINVSETGLYTLNFTVTDLDGNRANTSYQLLVTSYKPTIIQTFYYPEPAINATNVTISAWVVDQDGREDIYSVRANVTLLNTSRVEANETLWINLTDPDYDNIFENFTFINVTSAGNYEITIEAIDMTMNMKCRNFTINVSLEEVPTEEEEPTLIGFANPNAVGGGSNVWFSAFAKNGTALGQKIVTVQFSWEGTTYTMQRLSDDYFRYPNPFIAPLVVTTEIRDVDVWAKNSTGDIIATDTIKLLILFDETGGEVTKATALEKNVAWIAYDQGFVITNNKTSNKTVQVFELFDPKDKMCHVKIGSNMITNTEKVNIFQLTSRTTGEIIGSPYIPEGLEFKYDGVMAGYWFFNLSFSTADLFQYVTDGIALGKFPVGTNAEYFDVFMYIKDTTDDYFMTESWIVVTNSASPDFYAYLQFYYDSDYIPGIPITDGDGDKIPDDGVQGPADDYHTFQNTEVLYVEIITQTMDSAADVTFTNLEIQDFWGNHMVSNPPGQGAVGPISTHTVAGETHYIVAVDLLRADKDPWLMGKVAYTVIINGFKENLGDQEEFAYLAKQVIIDSPSSIMDIVSGHDYGGQGTYSDRIHGHYYENMNGYFEKYVYAMVPGTTGQADYIGNIWTVAFDDLDGDTDREIVTGREGDNNPTLSIWENLGGGYFEEIEIDYPGDEIHSVAIGHVDKVGSREPLDIVIGTDAGDVIYYRNDGTWDQTATIASGIGAVSVGHALEIADLDNDGDGDVVVGTSAGVKIIQNPTVGGGTWTTIDLHNPGTVMSIAIDYLEENYDTPAIEDFYPDIVMGDADSDVWRYLNDDTDLTAGSWDIAAVDLNIDANNNVYVDIGNIDGLAYLDVVAGCDDSLFWYENEDGGITWTQSANLLGSLPAPGTHDITAVRVGNVDGAIEDDIVISTTGESQGQYFAGGLIYYYRNLGRASEWMRFKVDDLFRLNGVMDINSIEIGDADLGS